MNSALNLRDDVWMRVELAVTAPASRRCLWKSWRGSGAVSHAMQAHAHMVVS